MTPLDRAIKASGGVTQLAKTMGLNQSVVSNWRMREQVSAKYALSLEQVSGVSRHDLRPDVFGEGPEPDTTKRKAA